MNIDISEQLRPLIEKLAKEHGLTHDEAQQLLNEYLEENPISIDGADLPALSFAEELVQHKDFGTWGVKLLSDRPANPCPHCYGADGDIYPIDYAIEVQPLPHDECTCESGCNCCYLPVSDDPRK